MSASFLVALCLRECGMVAYQCGSVSPVSMASYACLPPGLCRLSERIDAEAR